MALKHIYGTVLFLAISLLFSQAKANEVYSMARKTPSGVYSDPGSQFYLHGYITSSFAQPGDNFGNDQATSGQILVNSKTWDI